MDAQPTAHTVYMATLLSPSASGASIAPTTRKFIAFTAVPFRTLLVRTHVAV